MFRKIILCTLLLSFFLPVRAEQEPETEEPAGMNEASETEEDTGTQETPEAEEDTITMTVSLDGEPASLSFFVYEDEDTPLKDEEGEEVMVHAEEGNLVLPADDEGYYLRLEKTEGLHVYDEPYEISPFGEIDLHSLHVKFILQKEEGTDIVCGLRKKGEEEIIRELKKDTAIGSLLEEGASYEIIPLEMGEHVFMEPVEFEVSPDTEQIITCTAVSFYPYAFSLDQPLSGMTLSFQEEEKLKQYGLPAALKTDESGRISGYLPEGTYHIKAEISDSHYYADPSVHALQVKKGGRNQGGMTLKPVEFITVFNDASPYTVHVKENGTEIERWVNDGKEHVISAKRSHHYEIETEGGPDLYPLEAVSLDTGETYRQQKAVLTSHPFTTVLEVQDEKGQALAGAAVSIKRLKDGSTFTVKGTEIRGLYAGESYEASLVSVPEGWRADAPVAFTAGKDQVSFVLTPLVLQTIQLSYEDTQFVYQAFRDSECTVPLKDLEGRDVIVKGKDTFSLSDGVYYVKAIRQDPSCYPDEAVHELSVSHASGAENTLNLEIRRIRVRTVLLDQNNQPLNGVKMVLKDEKGTVKEVLSGEETDVEKGVRYALTLGEEMEGYQAEDAGVFMLGEEVPSAIPQASLHVRAYTDLSLKAVHEGKPVSGTYALYLDPDCRIPASDLSGQKAEGKTDENGILSLRMARGTYYLKQLDNDSHYFLKEEVTEAVLDGLQQTIDVENEPVSFRTVLLQESGAPVYGAVYALLNENREQITSWTFEGKEITITDEALQAGRVYYLQCTSMPAGFVKNQALIRFEMPAVKGEETMLVSLRAASASANTLPVTSLSSGREQKDMEEIRSFSAKKKIAAVLLCAAGVLCLLIVLEKCKKCKLKKNG